ncbi:unnamed protein product [Discosporangium mesarthrocarpum]
MDKEEFEGKVSMSREAIESLARWYAREAGVRNLSKLIDKVHRKLALEMVRKAEAEEDQEGQGAQEGGGGDRTEEEGVDGAVGEVEAAVAEGERGQWLVTTENLEKYVGKPTFTSDRLYEGELPPGVVMGLAWTSMGGSSLYIESMSLQSPTEGEGEGEEGGRGEKGKQGALRGAGGRLRTTGQLGSVMEESAEIAHSVSRKVLADLATAPDRSFFEGAEIHLHVPEGATPKDGPSAGVTMVTSLLSLATGWSVREDVAMTGELSLTGKVLPVGGIKEKTIAARRAGVSCLVFPKGNKRDFEELPKYLKEGLEVHFAGVYQDVFNVAFKLEKGEGEDGTQEGDRLVTRAPQ